MIDFDSSKGKKIGTETVTQWRSHIGMTPPRPITVKKEGSGIVHNMQDPLKKLREHREATKKRRENMEFHEGRDRSRSPARLPDRDLDYNAILRHADQKWAEYSAKQYISSPANRRAS